jgi:predicted GNAT family N-acyltransferase
MGDVEIPIRWASGPDDVRAASAVRVRVFHDEQGVPLDEELDALDEHALHLVAVAPDGGQVVATLRLLLGSEAKIGRVAVERDWRGRGIASRMLAVALVRARERGAGRVRLASQLPATGLYERAGFVVESEQFEEAGIPHVWMGLRLTDRG